MTLSSKFNQIATATATLAVTLVGLNICLNASVAPSVAQSSPGIPVQLLGLTSGNQLVTFTAQAPGSAQMIKITGVDGKLIGIDQRPANGMLYGLSDKSNLYTINPATGAATRVSRLAQPLDTNAKVSIDFNPVPDRLRVVDEAGNNLRINVDTGEVFTDKPLAYMPDDTNMGKTPRISAIAYTNAFAGPPSPTGVTPPTRTSQMFDLDSSLNALVQQSPPNDGRLKTIATLNLGLSSAVGFDIFAPRMGENTAFMVSDSILYSLNLTNGSPISLGQVGNGRLKLIDLAAMPMR